MASSGSGLNAGDEFMGGLRHIVSGPYLLCFFAAGILLMGAGTFMAANELLSEDPKDVMKILGFCLLGLGGVFLLSSTLLCVYVHHLNKRLAPFHITNDIFYAHTQSPFYGNRNDNTLSRMPDPLSTTQPMSIPWENSRKVPMNPDLESDQQDGIRFLAEAVVAEQHRKLSFRRSGVSLSSAFSTDSPVTLKGPSCEGQNFSVPRIRNYSRAAAATGREDHMKRCPSYQEFPQELMVPGYHESAVHPLDRDRSHSFVVSKEKKFEASSLSMRRRVTMTGSAKQTLLQNHRDKCGATNADAFPQFVEDEFRYPPELRKIKELPNEGSLKRKRTGSKKQKKTEICQLPNFDVQLLENLGITTDRPGYRRSISQTQGEFAYRPLHNSPSMSISPPSVATHKARHTELEKRSSIVMGILSLNKLSSSPRGIDDSKNEQNRVTTPVENPSEMKATHSDEGPCVESLHEEGLNDQAGLPPPNPAQAMASVVSIFDNLMASSPAASPRKESPSRMKKVLSVISSSGSSET